MQLIYKRILHFSQIIANCIRNTDGLARWGGEEFILVCPHSQASALKVIAEKVRQRVEAANFTNHDLNVTVSIGIATGHFEDIQHIIDTADRALYQAKEQGRNRVIQGRVA